MPETTEPETTVPETTEPPTTTTSSTTTTTTTTTLLPTTTTTLPPTTTTTTLPPTTTTTTTTTTTLSPTTTSSTTLPPSTVPETLPDGRPVPATIVFADDQVTLTGAVPSAEAADRLTAFATDFRLTPAPVVNQLTIDPTTPTSGGVRFVELNSVNFNSGDEVITPEHAQQLDRVVAAMEASPRATVHVVGNTDLQGDETRNLVVSQRRADAVVAYLVGEGVDPARLTTQPAGESNPLRTDATAEADAINRRVELVFYGLLDE